MAIILSPFIAFIMNSVVLIIQAFIFADGGIIVLSANIFNMGMVTLLGYFIYWVIRNRFAKKMKILMKKKKLFQFPEIFEKANIEIPIIPELYTEIIENYNLKIKKDYPTQKKDFLDFIS